MPDKPYTTQRAARYAFAADDEDPYRSRIVFKPTGNTLDILTNTSLYLKLRHGADIKQAEELTRQLNDLIDVVEYVQFHGIS